MTGKTGGAITPNVLIRTTFVNIMGMMNAIDLMRLSAAGQSGTTGMAIVISAALTDIMENDAI